MLLAKEQITGIIEAQPDKPNPTTVRLTTSP
jgi:hypothetical protein